MRPWERLRGREKAKVIVQTMNKVPALVSYFTKGTHISELLTLKCAAHTLGIAVYTVDSA